MGAEWEQVETLASVGIRDYFEHVITSREEGVEKPHRGIFESVMRRYPTLEVRRRHARLERR